MGLDMYLDVVRYVPVSPGSESHLARYQRIVDAAGLADLDGASAGFPDVTVSVRAAYWHKASAIHKWMVDNVQGGTDDCKNYETDRETLTRLADLCEDLLKRRDPVEAIRLLPPQAGFFFLRSITNLSFGSTELDEDYWDDLSYTEHRLRELLAKVPEDCWFSYRSSW